MSTKWVGPGTKIKITEEQLHYQGIYCKDIDRALKENGYLVIKQLLGNIHDNGNTIVEVEESPGYKIWEYEVL